MQSLPIGVVMIIGVLIASIESASRSHYLQIHSLLLVFGGSLAIFFLATPMNVLSAVIRGLRSLGTSELGFGEIKSDLMKLMEKRNLGSLSTRAPLVQYAADLWEQGVDTELFIVLLSQKKTEMESNHLDAVQALKNLAKYPPALGMLGTVIGMISLFAKLDENKSNIGISLSIAMTSTFFGLILTNALLSPLSDRLHMKHVSEKRSLEGIYEILLLINRGEPAALIREEMNQRAA